MKIFFDTEFIEDGRTIDLLSIGMVSQDGKSLYAEADWTDKRRASPWVKENVLPHLKGGNYEWRREDIAPMLIEFCGDKPEFWAYYADYDWVVLCQIFGTMMDLPKGWPMYCNDIKQLCVSLGNPRLPQQASTEHNALNDAIWTKQAYEFLVAGTKELKFLADALLVDPEIGERNRIISTRGKPLDHLEIITENQAGQDLRWRHRIYTDEILALANKERG